MVKNHPAIARAIGCLRAGFADAAVPLAGATLVVGYSGGADSGALLGLLRLVAGAHDLRLVAVHIDHGLRPESAAVATDVKNHVQADAMSCHVIRLSLEAGPNLAARARERRRAALLQVAATEGARAVVLAHTATDQAETMLMALARGASLPGLCGMPAARTFGEGVPLVRPLLAVTRDETAALCQLLSVPVWADPTNDDRSHLRVAIREEVLPVLRRRNPGVDLAMAATARDLAAARAVVDHAAAQVPAGTEASVLRREDLLGLPEAVRTAVTHRFVCDRAHGEVARGVVRHIAETMLAGRGQRRWDLAGAIAVYDGRVLTVGQSGPKPNH